MANFPIVDPHAAKKEHADVLKPGNVSPSQLIHAQPLSSLIWWMVVGDALGATVSQNIVVRPNYILLPPFQSSSV
jgi:hypothetical protein